MRVISGKFKGRRLKGPERLELRPTGDRLKETLFNILGEKVRGAVFLDVFGGSGAIGLEALSRGAAEVAFIEHSEHAQRLIRHNLKLCGIASGYRILKEDVFAAMRFLARKGFKADIVFFDPPYDFQPYRDLLDITFLRGLLQPSGIAVIEHHRRAALPDSSEGFERTRLVQQGDHWLSFFESRSQNEPPR
jgi:16S rRNA (guanine966-N2)-methyltransferase